MFRRHVIKELSSYIDSQLSERDRLRVEAHLETCKTCAQELILLKAASEKLKTWQPSGLDDSFDASVRNKIVACELERGEVKMKKKTLAILIPSGVLAGILVFVFLGNIYVHREFKGGFEKGIDTFGKEGYVDETILGQGGVVTRNVRYNASNTPQKLEYYDYKYGWVGGKDDNGISTGMADGGKVKHLSLHSSVKGVAVGSNEDNLAYMAGGTYYVNSDKPLPEEGRRKYASRTEKAGENLKETISYNQQVPLPEGPVIIIQPILPATGAGEYIIRTAQIMLEVEDGQVAYKKASDICQELGGYLSASNFYKDKEGRESGTITMRIPKDKFLTALDKLGTLGKVENSYTNSQDVSQQYVNLKTQLDAAMVVYNKMLEALQKRQVTIPEAIRLESELTPILRRVQDLKNQLEALSNSVSFTTITVNFHEAQISEKVLKETKEKIKESVLIARIKAVKLFANAIPNAIGVLFWLAVILAAALFVKSMITRILKR